MIRGGFVPAFVDVTPDTFQIDVDRIEDRFLSQRLTSSRIELKLTVPLATDVGQLEDKSFNQSSNEGAKAAAAAVGIHHTTIQLEQRALADCPPDAVPAQ